MIAAADWAEQKRLAAPVYQHRSGSRGTTRRVGG